MAIAEVEEKEGGVEVAEAGGFISTSDLDMFSHVAEQENDGTPLQSHTFRYHKKLDWSLSLPALLR